VDITVWPDDTAALASVDRNLVLASEAVPDPLAPVAALDNTSLVPQPDAVPDAVLPETAADPVAVNEAGAIDRIDQEINNEPISPVALDDLNATDGLASATPAPELEVLNGVAQGA